MNPTAKTITTWNPATNNSVELNHISTNPNIIEMYAADDEDEVILKLTAAQARELAEALNQAATLAQGEG